MRTAALCAGYGGLELGLSLAGVDHTVEWFAEIEDAPATVFQKRFDAPNLGDLTAITTATLVDMDLTNHQATAERRFALYQSGKSLEEVAEAEGISRQTVWKQFQRRGWELRARPTPKPFVEFAGNRYTMRDSIGYYGRTTGDRTLLHRDLWVAINGPIPPGYDVHHVDHDRTNNNLENLELIDHAEHTRLHARIAKKAGDTGNPTVDMITAGFP